MFSHIKVDILLYTTLVTLVGWCFFGLLALVIFLLIN